MMYAPGKVLPEEQQTAGIMMVCVDSILKIFNYSLIIFTFFFLYQSFFLNFGIFCATNFAVLLSFL